MDRHRLFLLPFFLIAIVCSTVAAAQTFRVETGTVKFSEIEIFIIGAADRPKTSLGTLPASGECSLPSAPLAASGAPLKSGAQYRVFVRRCIDGKIDIVLVAPGITPTRDQLGCADTAAGAGSTCECDDAGVVVWGPTMNVALRGRGMAIGGAPMSRGRLGSPWTVRLFGGFSGIGNPTAGDAAALPGGVPYATFGGRSSLAVPSFLFGDGASLVNGVLTNDGRATAIVPLDSALGQNAFQSRGGFSWGARVSRRLTDHFSVFGEVHGIAETWEIRADARQAFEQTATSTQTAIRDLVRLAGSSDVGANATFENGSGQRIFFGAGVEVDLPHEFGGGWSPYALAGIGVTHHLGSTPSASIAARYHFSTPGGVPFEQTDTLTFVAEPYRETGFTFGAGLKRRWTDRLDLSAEFTLFSYGRKDELEVTTLNTNTIGVTRGATQFITPSGVPTIVFSTIDVVMPSLQGGAASFHSFEASGRRTSWRAAGGVGFSF